MSDLQEYKCPCCGGAISFDSTLQKLKCPFCDTEFEIDTLKSYDEDLKQDSGDDLVWQEMPGTEWAAGEEENLSLYVCKSCGGEIIGDRNMAATSCPYCGNNVVVPTQFKGDLRPDYVIPFKLTKGDAVNALKNHLKGKRFLPRVFGDQNHIEEIKGIYVPFWLFDAEAEVNARYKATRSRMWTDADFTNTETNYYSISRAGTIDFDNVAVDGSAKIANDLMESIEPYNFRDAVEFQTAYLAGYLAERFSVRAEESMQRANHRIKESAERIFAGTVKGYDSVTTEACNVRLRNAKAKYALYPVWLLNTRWQDKMYTFAMNGQTGKFVGDLPEDKAAAGRFAALVGLGVAAATFAVTSLIWFL